MNGSRRTNCRGKVQDLEIEAQDAMIQEGTPWRGNWRTVRRQRDEVVDQREREMAERREVRGELERMEKDRDGWRGYCV